MFCVFFFLVPKTLKNLSKMYRKDLKSSNSALTMLLVQRRFSQNHGSPCALMAVLGSLGVVVKCRAAIFFLNAGLQILDSSESTV